MALHLLPCERAVLAPSEGHSVCPMQQRVRSAAYSTRQHWPPLRSLQTCFQQSSYNSTAHAVRRSSMRCSAAANEAVAERPAVDGHAEAGGNGLAHSGNGSGVAVTSDAAEPVAREWLPEEFGLPPGELSSVHREGLGSPADVFRCSGCSLPECQVCCAAPCQYLGFHYRQKVQAT